MIEHNIINIENIGVEADQLYYPFSNRPLLWAIILTVLISAFLRINTILNLGNLLYDAKTNSVLLYSIVFLAQFFMGTILVVVLLPKFNPDQNILIFIRSKMIPSRQLIRFGIVSGVIFLVISALLSIVMGIFDLNLSLLFGMPDVYVEPDVVGWFYFILALVPAVWEEIVFRGVILYQFRIKYTENKAILISSLFFSLYHFSVIVSKPIDAVIGGVIMSFFYGIAWGSLVLRCDSILPTMIAHYIIDTFGILFLNAEVTDVILFTQFMLMITVFYPILNWFVFRLILPDNKSNKMEEQEF